MKNKILWLIIICACAYGVLTYAIDNPNGARLLRDDINQTASEGVSAAKDAVESTKKYVDNLSDD